MFELTRRLRRNERGMSLVFVAVGFMAILSASMLAIDVGMVTTARSQAQNSADAGALAGATSLVFDSYTDRSPSGPAVQNSVMASRANQVMGATVSVDPADVVFLNDPSGEPNRVQVTVYRTGGRSNPLANFIAPFFGVPTSDVSATAIAEASLANAATCLKPWAVPDKWLEIQTPPFDANDDYDYYTKQGNPMPNPDQYVPVGSQSYTGYRSDPAGPDYGRQVLLKAGSPHSAISSSHFFPIALPGGNGGSWYKENIPGCWPDVAEIGDMVPVEPGNMTGPTKQGTEDLIAKDPGAYWDGANRKVVSSHNPSPRVVVIPVFDPKVYEDSRQHGRQDIQIANFVGFFIEAMQGNDVRGRIVPHMGLIRGNGTAPAGSFLRTIRLIQ
jgi:Flp pilus assembly protein TadG